MLCGQDSSVSSIVNSSGTLLVELCVTQEDFSAYFHSLIPRFSRQLTTPPHLMLRTPPIQSPSQRSTVRRRHCQSPCGPGRFHDIGSRPHRRRVSLAPNKTIRHLSKSCSAYRSSPVPGVFQYPILSGTFHLDHHQACTHQIRIQGTNAAIWSLVAALCYFRAVSHGEEMEESKANRGKEGVA